MRGAEPPARSGRRPAHSCSSPRRCYPESGSTACSWSRTRRYGEALRDEIRRRAARYEAVEVLVVSPALNSRLRRWFSDEDGARVKAQARLVSSLTTLADDGIVALGEIGDADPVQAIEDALCTFRADELIISTHPAGRSNWLERHVVRRAFECFRLPITHVIVDLEAEKAARAGRTGQISA